jgi:hypothetical protein
MKILTLMKNFFSKVLSTVQLLVIPSDWLTFSYKTSQRSCLIFDLFLCEKSHIFIPSSQMCIFALMSKDEYLF